MSERLTIQELEDRMQDRIFITIWAGSISVGGFIGLNFDELTNLIIEKQSQLQSTKNMLASVAISSSIVSLGYAFGVAKDALRICDSVNE